MKIFYLHAACSRNEKGIFDKIQIGDLISIIGESYEHQQVKNRKIPVIGKHKCTAGCYIKILYPADEMNDLRTWWVTFG